MIAPTLVFAVRMVLIVLYSQRTEIVWMVATLIPTPPRLAVMEEIWEVVARHKGLPNQQLRVSFESSAEGKDHRVEPESIRQAIDHHPRLQ